MKRNRFLCALFLISLSLCFLSGCATKEERIAKQVDTINEWRVQNNKDDSEYLLFFHFEDENRAQVITPVSLDVTITNDNDEIVYQSTFELSTEDYSEWSSPAKGEEFLPQSKSHATIYRRAALKQVRFNLMRGTKTAFILAI